MEDKYCIIEGYVINPNEGICDVTDQHIKGFGDSCQRDVYNKTADISVLHPEYKNVLDVGTGSGFKLMKHFSHLDTLGIDVEPNYSFLLNQYPDRRWEYADYSKKPEHFDIVICADVLEHVLDPDILMQYIKDATPNAIILSTPARELLSIYWPEHKPSGPPLNYTHIREWTTGEFENYVNKWFKSNEYTFSQSVFDAVGNMVILTKNV